nr:S8 family serine peptidase [Pseudoxanthomonas sacheonensis]
MHALAAATAIALSCVALSAFAADRINLTSLSNEGQDQFIVKYRDGSAQRSSDASLQRSLSMAATSFAGKGKALGLNRVRRTALGSDVVRAGRKLDRVEAAALMRQIAADPNVEYIEPDARKYATFTPNDSYFNEQWGYTGSGINATAAWDVNTGAGAVVAVLDTGITNHSDLNANILPGYDFISDANAARDGNGRDSNPADQGDWCGSDPSSWHGTHVTGTVAAVTNNGNGVAGTAYNAKVVPVRVLGSCGGSTSDIADAIIWASGGSVPGVPNNSNPAKAINLSLGGSGSCDSTSQAAINSAVSRGTTVVVAAGNGNTNVANSNPANCNNVIAVASVNSSGQRSGFSNYGAGIDIAAPGESILSTWNNGTTIPGGESYKYFQGTSMAAPHVAGVVALLQSASGGSKTPAQIETILKSTARAFPQSPSQQIGAGIVNARAALDSLGGGGGGAVGLINLNSGKALDTWSTNNGSELQQWDYWATDNQKWYITRGRLPDTWEVKSKFSGKCLSVPASSTTPGIRLNQWDCYGGTEQLWYQVWSNAQNFQLVNVNSTQCLDVSYGSGANGAAIIQWTCHTGNSQRWSTRP